MKVVVTGAGGFIGQQLVRRLTELGWDVVALGRDRGTGTSSRFGAPDITRPGAWSDAFAGAECVFHLAGKAHALSEIRQDDAEYFRVNTEGTRLVLEAGKSHNVRRFVLFSSTKAMSRDVTGTDLSLPTVAPLDESGAVAPDTPYGRSKLAAERLVLDGGFVPEPVILRLCMVYGAGAKGNLDKLLRAIDRGRLPMLPDVPNRRSMVHVQDVVSAAILAASHSAAIGETFIVSDGRDYSTRELISELHLALGRSVPRWSVPLPVLRILGRAGDMITQFTGRRFPFDSNALSKLLGSAWFSSEKVRSRLGFQPEWDLPRALPLIVAETRMGTAGKTRE